MHLNYNMLLAACQVPFWKFEFAKQNSLHS
jgi:hypothetical protein